MIDLEKLLGKEPKEISFYEDTQRIINFAEQMNKKGIYETLTHHYNFLAQLDGIREDMKKVAKYFEEKAEECERK